jgi:hypothetical protein
MDLERLGAPELAAKFLGWYVEYAGDPAPPSLLHHYLAYRAFVRAKVACLRAEQGDAAAVPEARLDASWSDQQRVHADLVALRCVAPPEVAADRLRGRSGISDADPSIASAMQADVDPWPEASEVDTTTAVNETVRQAAAYVRPKQARQPWLPPRTRLTPA